ERADAELPGLQRALAGGTARGGRASDGGNDCEHACGSHGGAVYTRYLPWRAKAAIMRATAFALQEGISMRHVDSYAFLSLVALSCVASGGAVRPGTPGPVGTAISAMGGAEKLGAMNTLTAKESVRHWEPEQSVKAGGDMRLASDSTITVTRSFANDSARVE